MNLETENLECMVEQFGNKKSGVGTKHSTPKATYRLRDRKLIKSPKKGWFYPAANMSIDDMNFVPGR